MAKDAQISGDLCARLINSATAHCGIPVPPPFTPPVRPDADLGALSVAIANQSNALVFWTGLLAIVAIVIGVGYGWLVKVWAEAAAREAVEDWMNRNAPAQLARLAEQLTPPTASVERVLTPEEQATGFEKEAS